MASEDVLDVIIIGAGVAGLTVAHQLKQKDKTVKYVILEAKDRVGGRTYREELKTASGTDWFDLGGQWVGSCQPLVMEMVKELGLEVFNQYITGTKLVQIVDGKIRKYEGLIPKLPWYSLIDLHLIMRKIENWSRHIPHGDPSKCAYADEWDRMTFAEFLHKNCWTKMTREVVAAIIRTMFGCDPEDCSLFFVLHEVAHSTSFEAMISAEEGMAQEFRIKGGAAQIAERLAERVGHENVNLNEPVISVEQDDEGVKVTTHSGKVLRSRYLVSAIPPNMLVGVKFTPPFPLERSHVYNRMPMGHLSKIHVTYPTTFWRDDGLSGEVATDGGPSSNHRCKKGPLCVTFDATTAAGDPAIVGFIGGSSLREYSPLTPEERQEAVMKSLESYLGPKARDYIDYKEKNWVDEPYNGGCPHCLPTPGVMKNFASSLRQPHMKMHFAGTETATEWPGYIDGAIQSGQRAANEVLHIINPTAVSDQDLEDTIFTSRPGDHWRERHRRHLVPHHVIRWTVGIGTFCVLIIVAKKAYFRIAI